MAKDVIIEAGVDTSAVQAGLAQLRKHVKESSEEIGGHIAKAFAIGSLVAFSRQIFETGERLENLSNKFGVSTTALQEWGHAAELNGSSIESVAGSLNKLEIARSKALGGNDKLAESFGALGVSVDDLKNLSPEELLKKIGSSSLDAADLVKVLGRGALELRPLLAGVADGSIALGKAMDDGTVKSLAAANRQFKEAGQTITIFAGGTLGFLIKSWQVFVNDIVVGALMIKEAVSGSVAVMDRLIHLDFAGAMKAAADGRNAMIEQARTGAETNTEIASGGAGTAGNPRFVGAAGGGSSAGTDDNGNAVPGAGGAGGGVGAKVNLFDRLAKIERDRYLDSLAKEKQIETIERERNAIQGRLNDGKAHGVLSDEDAAALQLDIYDRDKEIAGIRAGIATEAEKAADAETQLREQVAARAEKEDDALRTAKEQTAEMQQEAAGHADIAEQMRIEFEYAEKISAAAKATNLELVEQLEAQKKLALAEAKRAADEKKRQEDEEAAAKRKADEAAASAARDAGLGTGINNNNPNYTDVALGLATDPRTGAVDPVRLARERALAELRVLRGQNTPYQQVFDANRNLTNSAGYQTDAAMARAQAANIARQAQLSLQLTRPDLSQDNSALLQQILRQLEDTHHKMAEPIGG